MKRFLALLISVVLIFSFCGCENKNINVEKAPIKINLPTDDSVNGYRKTDSEIKTETIILNEATENYSYCGNKNSKKFHKANCSSLKNTKEENKVFYKTREEFINNSYSPCKKCNP